MTAATLAASDGGAPIRAFSAGCRGIGELQRGRWRDARRLLEEASGVPSLVGD
jgi:hypothetical protein